MSPPRWQESPPSALCPFLIGPRTLSLPRSHCRPAWKSRFCGGHRSRFPDSYLPSQPELPSNLRPPHFLLFPPKWLQFLQQTRVQPPCGSQLCAGSWGCPGEHDPGGGGVKVQGGCPCRGKSRAYWEHRMSIAGEVEGPRDPGTLQLGCSGPSSSSAETCFGAVVRMGGPVQRACPRTSSCAHPAVLLSRDASCRQEGQRLKPKVSSLQGSVVQLLTFYPLSSLLRNVRHWTGTQTDPSACTPIPAGSAFCRDTSG